MIVDQFKHAGAAKASKRFCVGRRFAKLRRKQRDTKRATHGRRKFQQVPTARSDPDELFRLEFIHGLFIHLYV